MPSVPAYPHSLDDLPKQGLDDVLRRRSVVVNPVKQLASVHERRQQIHGRACISFVFDLIFKVPYVLCIYLEGARTGGRAVLTPHRYNRTHQLMKGRLRFSDYSRSFVASSFRRKGLQGHMRRARCFVTGFNPAVNTTKRPTAEQEHPEKSSPPYHRRDLRPASATTTPARPTRRTHT